MYHFHHFSQNNCTDEKKEVNEKHNALMKMLLIHVGILALIILYIVLFRMLQ